MTKYLRACQLALIAAHLTCTTAAYAVEKSLPVPERSDLPVGAPVKQSDSKHQLSDIRPYARHSGFALTLAGGGARGAAHIGVLKVLEAEGLRPDFVAGSSIGAMVGGLYAAGVPVAELERLALSGELKKAFFPTNRKIQSVTYLTQYAAARSVLIHPQIGLYSGRSLSKFVTRHLPEGVTKIEDMPIQFACAAVDLTTTKSIWLSKGSIADALRASNSAPGFFRPLKIGDHVLVDGGVRTNLPTEIAQAQGAPVVVAVRLQAYLERVNQKEFDTTMDYGDRITSILLSEIENNAVSKADILIEPKIAYMKMSSFSKPEMEAAIKSGEDAARKMLPKIRALQLARFGPQPETLTVKTLTN